MYDTVLFNWEGLRFMGKERCSRYKLQGKRWGSLGVWGMHRRSISLGLTSACRVVYGA